MKSLTILPLLAVAASSNYDVERGFDGYGGFSSISDYTAECSNQVPSKGGVFEAPNYGTSGELTLDKYPNKLRCKHVVQADDSCSVIKISYRDIAVNVDPYPNTMTGSGGCDLDNFRFGWGQNKLTPPRCNCFGDGCSHDVMSDSFDIINDKNNFPNKHLGPTEFTIASNSFTFYFESIMMWKRGPNFERIPFSVDGHVILDWECVENEMTTTTLEPTTTATTATTTTT